MSILYVPQMAGRLGMTEADYWAGCAAQWRVRAASHERPLAALAEAAFCDYRHALLTGRGLNAARRAHHRADEAARCEEIGFASLKAPSASPSEPS